MSPKLRLDPIHDPIRVGLVADTHGYLDERIAAAVAACDIVVHAGDVGSGVAATLDNLSQKVLIVRGNNDPEGTWPEEAALDLPGGRLVVIHGHQWPAKTRHRKLRAAFPQTRAVVYGHSHRQVIDREQRPWILNPGAAGRTRTYGGPAGLILTAAEQGWRMRRLRFDKR